jgi:hypothetical protein
MKPMTLSHSFKHERRALARDESLPRIPSLCEQLAWLAAHPLQHIGDEIEEAAQQSEDVAEDEFAL